VEVRRSATVVDVVGHADHVVVAYDTREGARQRVTARYVVGCDGANSRVREALAPVIEDRGFFYDWAVLDVLPHDVRRVEQWEPRNLQICDPARPTTVVSAGPGRRRWEFFLLPDESPAQFETDEYAWKLLQPWGLDRTNADMERAAVYRFRALCCQTWRKGRMLVAGDAAHLMPPFFGQGMCSGVRDAANAAWKLDAVLRGAASEDLLDTYTTERVAHVQFALEISVELGKVICLTDPARVAARDAAMRAAGGRPQEALPPLPPAAFGEGIIRRGPDGTPTPPGPVFTTQGIVRLADGRQGPRDDLVGPGFALGAAFDPREHLSRESVDSFLRLGGTFEQFVPGEVSPVEDQELRQLADVDDFYLPHMAEAGFAAALVRPDYHLFGVARQPEDVQGLLDDLLDQLGVRAASVTGGAV
jgi:flavoprotein hydroxylase